MAKRKLAPARTRAGLKGARRRGTSAQGRASARPKNARKPLEYVLGKGTSRLLNARVDTGEIRLLVNGPTMLYGSCRLLTSLDAADGATFQAWNVLGAALTCTSLCGLNGKTDIPIVVLPSRIGTCLEFGTGPMSMYLATVVLRTKKRGTTFRQVIHDAFGNPRGNYLAMIVPEPATGHLEHDASIFEPDQYPQNEPDPGVPNDHAEHHAPGHDSHVHRSPQPQTVPKRRGRST
jgi:hypothetical protein